MKTASVAQVKSQLNTLLKDSEDGPVVVTRNGRPVAVIVALQDEDEIERLAMAYSPKLQAILEGSRQEIREGKGLSEKEFWAQFEQNKPSKASVSARRKKSAATSGRARRQG
jgi:prevent-host-death family protein